MHKEIKTSETFMGVEFAQFFQIIQFIKIFSFQFISVWVSLSSLPLESR